MTVLTIINLRLRCFSSALWYLEPCIEYVEMYSVVVVVVVVVAAAVAVDV